MKKGKKNNQIGEDLVSERQDSSADISFSKPNAHSSQRDSSIHLNNVQKKSSKIPFNRRRKVKQQLKKEKKSNSTQISVSPPVVPVISKWMFYDIPELNLKTVETEEKEKYTNELPTFNEVAPISEIKSEALQVKIQLDTLCDTVSKVSSSYELKNNPFTVRELSSEFENKSFNINKVNAENHPSVYDKNPDSLAESFIQMKLPNVENDPHFTFGAEKQENVKIYNEILENETSFDVRRKTPLTKNVEDVDTLIENLSHVSTSNIEEKGENDLLTNDLIVNQTVRESTHFSSLSDLVTEESSLASKEAPIHTLMNPVFVNVNRNLDPGDEAPLESEEKVELKTFLPEVSLAAVSLPENEIKVEEVIPSESGEVDDFEQKNGAQGVKSSVLSGFTVDSIEEKYTNDQKESKAEVEKLKDVEIVQPFKLDLMSDENQFLIRSSVENINVNKAAFKKEPEVGSSALEEKSKSSCEVNNKILTSPGQLDNGVLPTIIDINKESEDFNQHTLSQNYNENFIEQGFVLKEEYLQENFDIKSSLDCNCKKVIEENSMLSSGQDIDKLHLTVKNGFEEKYDHQGHSFENVDKVPKCIFTSTSHSVPTSALLEREIKTLPLFNIQDPINNEIDSTQLSFFPLMDGNNLSSYLNNDVSITNYPPEVFNEKIKTDVASKNSDFPRMREDPKETFLPQMIPGQPLPSKVLLLNANENVLTCIEKTLEKEKMGVNSEIDHQGLSCLKVERGFKQELICEDVNGSNKHSSVSFLENPIVIEINHSICAADAPAPFTNTSNPVDEDYKYRAPFKHDKATTILSPSDSGKCLSILSNKEEEDLMAGDVESELTRFSEGDPSQIYSHDLSISTLIDEDENTNSDSPSSNSVLLSFNQTDLNQDDTSATSSMYSKEEEPMDLEETQPESVPDMADAVAAMIASELLNECPSHPFEIKNEEDLEVSDWELQQQMESKLTQKMSESLKDFSDEEVSGLQVNIDPVSYTVVQEESFSLEGHIAESEDAEKLKNATGRSFSSSIQTNEGKIMHLGKKDVVSKDSEYSTEVEPLYSEDKENQLLVDTASHKHAAEDFSVPNDINDSQPSSFPETNAFITAAAAEDEILSAFSKSENQNIQSPIASNEAILSNHEEKLNTMEELNSDTSIRSRSAAISEASSQGPLVKSILSAIHEPGMPPALEYTMHLSFLLFIIVLVLISFFTWGNNVSYYALFLIFVNLALWILTTSMNSRNQIAIEEAKKKRE